jgi:hypothetical protein
MYGRYKNYINTYSNQFVERYEESGMISVVILSYNRPNNFKIILETLLSIPLIDEIIISHGKEVNYFEYSHSKVIHYYDAKLNDTIGVGRRFTRAIEARNDCILLIDDDNVLTESGVHKLYNEYVKDPYNIYGDSTVSTKVTKDYTQKHLQNNNINDLTLKVWDWESFTNNYNINNKILMMWTRRCMLHKQICQDVIDNIHIMEDIALHKNTKPLWNGEDIFMSLLFIKKYRKNIKHISLNKQKDIIELNSQGAISIITNNRRYRILFYNEVLNRLNIHDIIECQCFDKESFMHKPNQEHSQCYEGYVDGQRYVLIHIGKSGGTTILRYLDKYFKKVGIKFYEIHMHQAVYQPNTKYILWIRNPLTRYVSAFNWVHEIVTNPDKVSGYNLQKEGILGPISKNNDGSFLIYSSHIPKNYAESIKHFGDSNNLAEQIYTNHRALNTMVDYTQHINTGLAFYLDDGEFIKNHSKDIVFVGTLEHFDKDILELKKFLNIDDTKNLTKLRVNKSGKSKHLSPLAIENLKKFYEKDYYCIQLLVQYNLIDYKKVEDYFK